MIRKISIICFSLVLISALILFASCDLFKVTYHVDCNMQTEIKDISGDTVTGNALGAGVSYELKTLLPVKVEEDNNGDLSFNADVAVKNCEIISSTLSIEGGTSENNIKFTEDGGTYVSNFVVSIPNSMEKTLTYELDIVLMPVYSAESKRDVEVTISLSQGTESEDEYTLSFGSQNEKLFSMNIVQSQLDNIELTQDIEYGYILWNNISNARCYEIYAGENEEPVAVVEPETTKIGESIRYYSLCNDLTEHGYNSGSYTIKVVAIPTNVNYLSQESNNVIYSFESY